MTNRRSPGIDRRAFLRISGSTAAALTIGSLAACATTGGTSNNGATGDPTQKPADPDNPLGVPPDAPLEAVIFQGGYGDQYVIDAEQIYQSTYPQAVINHTAGQELGKQLQPRFISGDVPDLIDNSGSGNLPMAALVANGQLTDLSPLLDAPAIDGGGKTVRETLLPGVVELGSFDGVPYALNYAFVVHGIFHSRSLFEQRGWESPETWDDMLALCEEIKSTGMSPWTYQGKNPGYMLTPILMAATKAGGPEVTRNIDNLEDGAWTDPAVMAAAEAFYRLVENDYLLPGTSGLTHTQAQTYWAMGDAAFIPCGSWLESELGDVTPEGFDMVVTTTPGLTSADVLPLTAIRGMASEPFIVPAQAENPNGAMELLRIMLSPDMATNFTDQTQTLTSVSGYTPTDPGTGLTSVRDALAASGDDTFYWVYNQWYSDLSKQVNDTTSAMMSGQINPDQWAQQCQQAADAIKADDAVTKYQRD